MRIIFLDTSGYSEFKRNNSQVIEEIRKADRLFVNPIVIGELLAGFDGGKYKQQNRRELREFLGRDSVTVHSISEETSERYSVIHQYLKKKGTPISANDLWIAASVLETGAHLVTADSDFLKLEMISTVMIIP
ncbi:MAG: type II toxin-antitoxin system VapC family toxin [Deltaproteobacteria bacterium]|nr:type II toxin-antitoxin system VapC family toxin [Deltaproteobacteria bacterium]